MTPKRLFESTPFGLANCAWLKALKNSARICRVMPSRIEVSLCSARFQLFNPGPWKKRRGAVPKFPSAGRLNPCLVILLARPVSGIIAKDRPHGNAALVFGTDGRGSGALFWRWHFKRHDVLMLPLLGD